MNGGCGFFKEERNCKGIPNLTSTKEIPHVKKKQEFLNKIINKYDLRCSFERTNN